MKTLRFLVLAAALVLSYTVAAIAAPAPVSCTKKVESFDFVVDYSGSMMMHYGKTKDTKIGLSKKILHRINSSIPEQSFNGGLHTISPNGTIYKQGAWDRAQMHKSIDKLRDNFPIFGRMTFMGDSLNLYQPFLSSMAREAAIILFSDGGNNRGIDFIETARQIYATQKDLVIHVVSFADNKNDENVLKAVAAMNPAAQFVKADALLNDADLERFVIAVFCGKTAPKQAVLVLRGVNFAFDSYVLDAKAKSILDEAAGIIKQQGSKNIVLSGWTDSKGSDAYNARLSLNRAKAVKTYLSSRGIPASCMSTVGRGKSFKYDNGTEEGAYLNRRTEVSF